MKLIPLVRFVLLTTGLSWAQNGTATSSVQPGEIRGSVIEPGTNHGIADTEITVRLMSPRVTGQVITTKELAKITTDGQGNFSYQPSEFGEYILMARKDGYTAMSGNPMRVAPSTQINVTLDGDHPSRQVQFSLSREGELTGRVIDDETGQPLTKVAVNIRQFYFLTGIPRWFPAGGRAVTDTDGRFVARNLRPGQYVVTIPPRVIPGKDQFQSDPSEKDLKAVDEDYRRSYWPGGGDLDSAQPVSLVSGGFADAGTIRLRRTPFYRIHVSVSNVNCTPGEKVQIMTMMLSNQFSETNSSGETACGSDFVLKNYQPGRYNLILFQGKSPNRTRGNLSFDVVDKNLDLVATLNRGFAISGRFLASARVVQIPL
jgi:hypothetical protein